MSTISNEFYALKNKKTMHISAFCKVKDDADIIESYCRYHLSFMDSIVVWDDCSSDSTPEIVKCLATEGLAVELIEIPKDAPHLRDYDLNALHDYALHVFNKYNADLVVPLDVDEFLFCEDGSNPREALERLDNAAEHRLFWRTSVYNRDPDDGNIFLPDYFDEYRDPDVERFSKTLLSRYIVENCGGTLAAGKHGLLFPNDEIRKSVHVINNDLIRIAHFPIRSTNHAMVKTICVQLKTSTFLNAKPFQYKPIYEDIKSKGKPTPEQVRQFSLEYASKPNRLTQPVNTIKQFRGALKADFLTEDIRLIYTNYRHSNYLDQILSFFELLLEKMKMDINTTNADLAEAKSALGTASQISEEIEAVKLSNLQLEKIVQQKESELQQSKKYTNQLLNSTCWRITKPMRVIMNLFRN